MTTFETKSPLQLSPLFVDGHLKTSMVNHSYALHLLDLRPNESRF